MCSKRFFFIAGILLSLLHSAKAQSESPLPLNPGYRAETMTPTSPEVASLGRYAMQAPDHSNGLPQQSIPLYEIKESGLTYPIHLFYNYSGFRPREQASQVGLGWGLSEGVITRIVKDLPDESEHLYKKYEDYDYRNLQGEGGAGVDDCATYGASPRSYDYTANRLLRKMYDGKPDVYVFNFNGYSGRFLWIGNKAIVLPHSDLRINKVGSDFIIITPDGVEYTFGAADGSITEYYNWDFGWTTEVYASGCGGGNSIRTFIHTPYTTAWRLKKIQNQNTKAKIEFTYGMYAQETTVGGEEIHSIAFWTSQSNPDKNKYDSHDWMDQRTSSSRTGSTFSYLKEISSDNVVVKFESAGRLDFPEAKAINKIEVFRKDNLLRPIKSFKLDFEYFGSSSSGKDYSWLKLKRLHTYDYDRREATKRHYEFSYINEAGFPGVTKKSFNVDHWGYFNHAINNSTFVPKTKEIVARENTSLSLINLNAIQWANRNPSFNHARYFALEKITYPTQGYSSINYESAGGRGIRVRSVEDNDGISSYSKYYEYYPDLPVEVPKYSYDMYMEDFCGSTTDNNNRFFTVYAHSRSTLDFFDESSNFYERTTEYLGTPDGQGGRTVYEYSRDRYSSYKTFLTQESHYTHGVTDPIKVKKYNYTADVVDKVQYWSDPALNTLGSYRENWGADVEACAREPLSYYGYLLSDIILYKLEIPVRWFKQTSTEEHTTGPSGTVVEVIRQYYKPLDATTGLPSHTNPIKVEKDLSNGSVVSSELFYPGDADPDNTSLILGVPQMWDPTNVNYKHLRTPIVKSRSFVGTALQASDVNHFTYNSTYDHVLRTAYEEHPSGTSEKKAWAYAYDSEAKLTSIQKDNGARTSYIWGYGKSLPVAEAVNAAHADIAYTSFEADEADEASAQGGASGWRVPSTDRFDFSARTGNKCYLLSRGSIYKSGLTSSKTYVVSYWTRNSTFYSITGTQGTPLKGESLSGWTYYEHKITGRTDITLSGSGNIDELRLYPSEAQMTTYTYEPLVGMTSATDPNGRSAFYEYDNFGRLLLVRDDRRNIIKGYCYNYAGQVEDCRLGYATINVYNHISSSHFTVKLSSPSYSKSYLVGGHDILSWEVPPGSYTLEITNHSSIKTYCDINGYWQDIEAGQKVSYGVSFGFNVYNEIAFYD